LLLPESTIKGGDTICNHSGLSFRHNFNQGGETLKLKHLFNTGLVLAAVTILIIAGGGPVLAKDIRISSCNAMTHPQNIGLTLFQNMVQQETGGKLKVKIYPNSQLGGERESVEQVKNRTLEVATASAGPLTTFNEDMMVMDIPFLFKNYEIAWMVLDGPAGEAPIYKPEDLKGIKIRTMEAPMHMTNFKALGANPTPVPWPELYMVLQQKIVDGQENPLMNIWEVKFYEVQKYVSLSGHIYDPMPLVANLEWFNKLTKDQQKTLEIAGIQAQNSSRFVNLAREQKLAELLEGKGMKINPVSDAEKARFMAIRKSAVHGDFATGRSQRS
jgi:TRAP-type C4-dicarboxylate transport system substrate-binding protein